MSAVLEVTDIKKNFGGISAVDGVTFDVHEGEILGLIGPNGCGKSTLFNCILGQLTPTGGEVKLDGKVVTGLRPSELNQLGVSRTFQLLQVFPKLSVRENLILAGQEHQGNMISRLFGPSDAGLTAAANQMIGFFKLDHLATSRPAGCPMASKSCSTPRWPSWAGRGWCCSTSPPAASTSRCSATSRSGWSRSTARSTPPSS